MMPVVGSLAAISMGECGVAPLFSVFFLFRCRQEPWLALSDLALTAAHFYFGLLTFVDW